MKILLNGTWKEIKEMDEIKEGPTIAQLLEKIRPPSFFAVALNQTFVPKSEYGLQKIRENDQIEIVSPHPGG